MSAPRETPLTNAVWDKIPAVTDDVLVPLMELHDLSDSLERTVAELRAENLALQARVEADQKPIPMILFCPYCGASHIDEGEWATKRHKTHLCAKCGFTWRPCAKPTVGVAEIDEFGPVDFAIAKEQPR